MNWKVILGVLVGTAGGYMLGRWIEVTICNSKLAPCATSLQYERVWNIRYQEALQQEQAWRQRFLAALQKPRVQDSQPESFYKILPGFHANEHQQGS